MSDSLESPQALAATEQYITAAVNLQAAIPTAGVALDGEDCRAYGRNLKGKTVIVTGAGSGFGRAFSTLAASYGAKVVVSDLNLAQMQELVVEIKRAGGEATAVACDVTSWQQQVELFKLSEKAYGVVDVVFPNAGITESPKAGEWLRDVDTATGEPKKPSFVTLDVNLMGVAYTTKLAYYYLRKNPSKSKKAIVMIGSMASHTGIPGAPMYSAAKHAVLGLFRSLYFDGQLHGINTNIICPWFTDTGIVTPLTRAALIGLPLCTVDDVVSAVVRSAADESFSGNTVVIDAKGILALPYEAFSPGSEGYYAEFARRASMSLSVNKIGADVAKVLQATMQYWCGGPKGKLFVLGLVFAIFRFRRGRPAP